MIVSLTVGCLFSTGCNMPMGTGMAGMPPWMQGLGQPQQPGGVRGTPLQQGPGMLGVGSTGTGIGTPGLGLGGGALPPAGPTTPGSTLPFPGTTPGTPPAPGTGPIVCIDPGHPSEVSAGTKAADGTTEIWVAWQVALRLRQILMGRGLRVVMTKSSEMQMVTNRERAEIGNRANASLCVRLHCDAASGTGFALYAPDRQGSTQGVTGPTQQVITSSTAAARAMLAPMQSALAGSLATGGVRGDSVTSVGSRQGALTGSIFSKIPIVTVEMCVLTNARDAAFIKTAAGQDRMAQALAAGMLAALGQR